MPASEAPALNTTQPALEPPQPHNIDYLEDRVQEDANYQVQWPKWISDGKKNSFYKYVFVLLLSWHPECDDMAVEKEVSRTLPSLEQGLLTHIQMKVLTLQRSKISKVFSKTPTTIQWRAFFLIVGNGLCHRFRPTMQLQTL